MSLKGSSPRVLVCMNKKERLRHLMDALESKLITTTVDLRMHLAYSKVANKTEII